MNINKFIATLLIISFSSGIQADTKHADLALRILKFTKTDTNLDRYIDKMSEKVISSWKVDMMNQYGIEIPSEEQAHLRSCYINNMGWTGLKDNIVNLYVGAFEERELNILLDFYKGRGLQPDDVETMSEIQSKLAGFQDKINSMTATAGDVCLKEMRTLSNRLADELI